MSSRFSFGVIAALLAASANGHVTISNPKPWTGSITSPLGAGGGGTFPCQGGIAKSNGAPVTNIAVGEKQTMSFSGSATHGGGSCQISITTGTANANSKFKVIQSMEGDCPLHSFDYTLPSSVPNGDNTLVWTWFPHESGGEEIYMNCAAIKVTGGASDETGLDALPDMLVANLNNGCSADPNSVGDGTIDLQFPDPGQTVIKASGVKLTLPQGNCGSSGSSSGGASAAPVSSAAAASTPAGAASTPAPVASTPVASSVPANTGGGFAPGASSAPAASGVPGTSFTTIVATTTAALPSSPPASTPAASGGSSSGGTTSCATDGAIVCNGSTQFGICNHGSVVWQDVAPGTTCSNGVISKRGVKIPARGRIQRPRRNAPM